MTRARALLLTITVVSVGYFAAFKLGWVPLAPWIFAGVVAVLMLLVAFEGAVALADVRRGRTRPLRGLGRLGSVAGLLVVCGGGMANWLLGMQAAVILTENESVRLSRADQMQAWELGPLARVEELGAVLQLVEFEFRPAPGGFVPISRLSVRQGAAPASLLTLAPGQSAGVGPLRFYQGAFGFAPRIGVEKDGKAVFDRFVPFTTQRVGRSGLGFEGQFEIEKERLAIAGSISLEDLDDRMRGHPRLELAVRRDDELLGTGDLVPGHFAELAGGYRVGFVGLKRWVEIDVSRRNYAEPMRVGALLAVVGGLTWLLGIVRR